MNGDPEVNKIANGGFTSKTDHHDDDGLDLDPIEIWLGNPLEWTLTTNPVNAQQEAILPLDLMAYPPSLSLRKGKRQRCCLMSG